MALRDGEMHVFAGLGAVIISVALAVPSVALPACNERVEAGPLIDDDMEAIEASLAYKKPNAPKQPQKETRTAVKVDPQGVSRDETKKVEKQCCMTKADCATANLTYKTPCDGDKVCRDFQCVKEQIAVTDPDPTGKVPDRTTGLDVPVGEKDNTNVGAFDGSEYGIGDVTKGDPYFQRLVADLAWEAPELARGTSEPVGCIQLAADGKIPQTKFKERGDDDLATLAESALKGLQRKRNDKPEEVPTHLLGKLTTKWVCFKFAIRKAE